MRQICVQAVIRVGTVCHIGEQLTGIDEIALGLDGIVLDVISGHIVGKTSVVDALVIRLDIRSEILADKAVKERAENIILFEVPAIGRAAHVVCDFLDFPL